MREISKANVNPKRETSIDRWNGQTQQILMTLIHLSIVPSIKINLQKELSFQFLAYFKAPNTMTLECHRKTPSKLNHHNGLFR